MGQVGVGDTFAVLRFSGTAVRTCGACLEGLLPTEWCAKVTLLEFENARGDLSEILL